MTSRHGAADLEPSLRECVRFDFVKQDAHSISAAVKRACPRFPLKHRR